MEQMMFDKQPIEKALEDWGAEISGINTLLGCCELLRAAGGSGRRSHGAGSGRTEDAPDARQEQPDADDHRRCVPEAE